LQLARAKELAPTGIEFADACMRAASDAASDDKRIAALVAQLTDPSPAARATARNDLAATGIAGGVAALQALANEPDANRRNAILRAAAQMDPLIRGPALAMLDTSDPILHADIAALLHHMRVPQALPLLLAGSASAERALTDAIEQYRRGMQPFERAEQDRMELWQWCDASKAIASVAAPADDARIVWMSKLAQRRAIINPSNREFRRDAIVLSLEADSLLRSIFEGARQQLCATSASQTYSSNLSSADIGLLNEMLADALRHKYAHAATLVARELGRRRDPHSLYTADGELSPLADSLHFPNRRVRFAALEAIMAIDPASPFPGASRVPESLTWFAGGNDERRAVVAMPSLSAGTRVAGMLNGQGFRAEATNNGLAAVKFARQTTDLELIFIDMDIDTRGIRDALYELRIHPRTGEIPIALLAPDGELGAAEKLASEHQGVIAAPRIHSTEVLARLVEQLKATASRPLTDSQQRLTEAEQARVWLDDLAATRPFYTIRRPALMHPAPAPPPADVLPAPPEL
jgi:CheY-like chemotaxis protein